MIPKYLILMSMTCVEITVKDMTSLAEAFFILSNAFIMMAMH